MPLYQRSPKRIEHKCITIDLHSGIGDVELFCTVGSDEPNASHIELSVDLNFMSFYIVVCVLPLLEHTFSFVSHFDSSMSGILDLLWFSALIHGPILALFGLCLSLW